ncbi:MAG: tannase/feruloyl esterase family alpha/beta hydrolase [Acidobacteriia bacterium]|nr:tannase/feruloyl esterase family alpha/beta hydrolase [Terriglobia bacterium]
MSRLPAMRPPATILLVLVAIAAVAVSAAPAPADSCTLLANSIELRSLPNTTMTSAETVSGDFTPPGGGAAIRGLPSFCRVAVTLKPTPVSDIKIEVWMPAQNWNQKMQGVGNGGLAGTISYGALASAVAKGYAAVSTDTGHVVSDDSWLPVIEREKDYGYRAIHEMTVTAKAIVEKFYGKAARRSYFNGCSTGGGQGFGEAQLYPADYDGIVAGAPQIFPTRLRAAHIWNFQAASNDPASNLPKQTLTLVTAAVLKQCGGDHGVADGFLSEDPRACGFVPAQLLCKAGQDTGTCLSAAQVAAVVKIYGGLADPRSKRTLWPGLAKGSEGPAGAGAMGWQAFGVGGPRPFVAAEKFYSLAVLENPQTDFQTIDAAGIIDLAEKKFPFLRHTSTDLSGFTARGGKLLIYHGWADPGISSLNTIDYYGALVEATRKEKHMSFPAALEQAQQSARLFMVPGMGHCSGGPGPDNFDAVGALDQWVEQGAAPEKIVASHQSNGAVEFSRPLCPFPQEARYTGSGDRRDASNWACVARQFTFDASFYGAR